MNILPEYGSLEIADLQEFLRESKQYVSEVFNTKPTIDQNFNFEGLGYVKTIGMGSFGTVLLMKKKADSNYYAVKAINKELLVRTKQIHHILNEKKILSVMNFPFIVYLVKFWSDNSYLYFAMPFISGGDLFKLLKTQQKLDENLAMFYASQVVLALEYLHNLDIIYRDLKPENILVDHTGFIKLTDFGFGKMIKSRTWTLCGTPEYLAPEIVLNKGYGKGVDWWALGVFVFEMMSGRTPFFAKEHLKIYERIVANRYIFPPILSHTSKDIIKQLLQPNISARIGCLKNGVQDIKNHQWFNLTNWLALLNRKIEPPLVPEYKDPGGNFGNFKNVPLSVSYTDKFIKEFENFYECWYLLLN